MYIHTHFFILIFGLSKSYFELSINTTIKLFLTKSRSATSIYSLQLRKVSSKRNGKPSFTLLWKTQVRPDLLIRVFVNPTYLRQNLLFFWKMGPGTLSVINFKNYEIYINSGDHCQKFNRCRKLKLLCRRNGLTDHGMGTRWNNYDTPLFRFFFQHECIWF